MRSNDDMPSSISEVKTHVFATLENEGITHNY